MNLQSVATDVDILNDEVERVGNSCALRPFVITADGNSISVEFLGSPIWDTELDERDDDDFAGSPDGREPLFGFLLREANKILENLPREIKYHVKTK